VSRGAAINRATAGCKADANKTINERLGFPLKNPRRNFARTDSRGIYSRDSCESIRFSGRIHPAIIRDPRSYAVPALCILHCRERIERGGGRIVKLKTARAFVSLFFPTHADNLHAVSGD